MVLSSALSQTRNRKIALIPQPLLPERENGGKIFFLVPLSLFGRGARGEGLSNICVSPNKTGDRYKSRWVNALASAPA